MSLAKKMDQRLATRIQQLRSADLAPGQKRLMLDIDKAQRAFIQKGGAGDLLLGVLLAQVLDCLRATPAGEARQKLARYCADRMIEVGNLIDPNDEAEVTALVTAEPIGAVQ